MQYLVRFLALAIALWVFVEDKSIASSFNIVLDCDDSFSLEERALFQQAESYWENIITGYQDSRVHLPGISVSITEKALGTGTLASTQISSSITVDQRTYPACAVVNINTTMLDDMYNGQYLYPVVLHELGHALGYGAALGLIAGTTTWTADGLHVYNTDRYTGTAALEAYQAEFHYQSEQAWEPSYVPVELGGGAGTANYHWNEVDQGAGLTGIVDSHGRDMRYELMTGWMETWTPSSLFISQTTIHQFEDLGYTVLNMPGDASLDGFVDGTDLNTVLSNYNATGMDWAQGDFNDDTLVNGSDLNTVLSYYNQNNGIYGMYGSGGSGGVSSSVAVPEPSTAGLLAVAPLIFLVWVGWKKSFRRDSLCHPYV